MKGKELMSLLKKIFGIEPTEDQQAEFDDLIEGMELQTSRKNPVDAQKKYIEELLSENVSLKRKIKSMKSEFSNGDVEKDKLIKGLQDENTVLKKREEDGQLALEAQKKKENDGLFTKRLEELIANGTIGAAKEVRKSWEDRYERLGYEEIIAIMNDLPSTKKTPDPVYRSNSDSVADPIKAALGHFNPTLAEHLSKAVN